MKLATCGIAMAILFGASLNTYPAQAASEEDYKNLLEQLYEVADAVTKSASKSERAKVAVKHNLDNWRSEFEQSCSTNSADNNCFDRANQRRMQLQEYIIDEGLLSAQDEHLSESDKWLNHIYGVLTRKLSKRQLTELRQSQRDWLLERDGECKGNEEKGNPIINPLSGKPLGLWSSLYCIASRNDQRSIQLDTMLGDNEPRKGKNNKRDIEGGFVEYNKSTYDVTANVPEVIPAEDAVTITYEPRLAKYKIAISSVGGNLHMCEGEAFFVRKGNTLLIDTSKAGLKMLNERLTSHEAQAHAAACRMHIRVLPHTLLIVSDQSQSDSCSFIFGCGMRAGLPFFVRRGTIPIH